MPTHLEIKGKQSKNKMLVSSINKSNLKITGKKKKEKEKKRNERTETSFPTRSVTIKLRQHKLTPTQEIPQQ